MTANNDFEKKLESAFSDLVLKDSLVNINEMKTAQFEKITTKPNYFPYVIIFVLVSIILFTAFESATISSAVKSADDPSMNELLYSGDNYVNSLYTVFQSGKMSAVFIFLLLEAVILYVGFLILELSLSLIMSVFRSKEVRNLKIFF